MTDLSDLKARLARRPADGSGILPADWRKAIKDAREAGPLPWPVFTHTSAFAIGAHLGRAFTQDDIRHEPLLFGACLDFARAIGGPLTTAFVNALPPEWQGPDVILDTRAHMLQTGYWPCIPGWHHDDVPRGADGQPDYDRPAYHAHHVMCAVNAEICPTLFLPSGTQVTVPRPPPGSITYGVWHPLVSKLAAQIGTVEAPDSTLLYFDAHTWHTGQAAKAQGWRWFARASKDTRRPFENDVRTQVNVYVPVHDLMAGW